ELDTGNDAKGLDDAVAPEPGPARRSFFPSSVGMSFLLPAKTKQLRVTVRWADYQPVKPSDGGTLYHWRRIPQTADLSVTVPSETSQPAEQEDSQERWPETGFISSSCADQRRRWGHSEGNAFRVCFCRESPHARGGRGTGHRF